MRATSDRLRVSYKIILTDTVYSESVSIVIVEFILAYYY